MKVKCTKGYIKKGVIHFTLGEVYNASSHKYPSFTSYAVIDNEGREKRFFNLNTMFDIL